MIVATSGEVADFSHSAVISIQSLAVESPFSGKRIEVEVKTMREIVRSWLGQSVLVIATFALVGFLISLVVFSNAPLFWSGSTLIALASGVGGGLGWLSLCGMQSQPAWWRTLSAGILAGIVVHPIYLLLACLHTWEPILLTELMTGTMFSLLIGGIISVPGGLAAAIICRIAGGRWGRMLAEYSHGKV